MKTLFLLFVVFVGYSASFSQSRQNPVFTQPVKNIEMQSITGSYNSFIENITIFPNPVVDLLKISFKSNRQGSVHVFLFNTIGKQVLHQESLTEIGNNVIAVNVKNNSIDPGIYFVKIEADENVFTRKLIVK